MINEPNNLSALVCSETLWSLYIMNYKPSKELIVKLSESMFKNHSQILENHVTAVLKSWAYFDIVEYELREQLIKKSMRNSTEY